MRLRLSIVILGTAFVGCGDSSSTDDGPSGNDLAHPNDLRASDLRGADLAQTGGDMSMSTGDMSMSTGDMSANAGDMASKADLATGNDLSTVPDFGVAGDLAGACTSACDCQPGQGCFGGRCTNGGPPTYCCSSPTCPNGSVCQNTNGGYALCPMRTDGGVADLSSNRDLSGAFCGAVRCNNGGVALCMMFGCTQCVPDQMGNSQVCAP
jgi:hypothetical protein